MQSPWTHDINQNVFSINLTGWWDAQGWEDIGQTTDDLGPDAMSTKEAVSRDGFNIS